MRPRPQSMKSLNSGKLVKRFGKYWHTQEHTQRMYKKHSNLFAILEFNYFSMWVFLVVQSSPLHCNLSQESCTNTFPEPVHKPDTEMHKLFSFLQFS